MKRSRPFRTSPVRTTADAVEDAVAREDRARHYVGINELAEMIGRSRDTISDWINRPDDPCPVARKGGAGEKTQLDPRDVLRWRESWIRKDEASKYARPSAPSAAGEVPFVPPKTTAEMIKLEQLKQQQIKIAISLEQVVLKSSAIEIYEIAIGILRTSMMGVPERLVREMAGFPEEQQLGWRLKAVDHCRSALKEAEKYIAKAMKGYKPGSKPIDPGMPEGLLSTELDDEPEDE